MGFLRKSLFPAKGEMLRPLGICKRRHFGSCALALSVIAGTWATLGDVPAGAAGNGPLAKEILTDPLPGWVAMPQTDLASTISGLQKVESAAAKITGMSAVVAGNGWYSSNGQLLEIDLVAFVGKTLNAVITRSLQIGAKLAAEDFCEGATTDPPITVRSITSPPGYLSTCHELDGRSLKAVAFNKGDLLGLLISTVTSAQLVEVSQHQYETIPSAGFEPSAPPSTGRIGTTETVTSTGKAYAVKLTAVMTPAQPATTTFTGPKPGDRYVAVHFTIRDSGSANVTGDADYSATVTGSNDQIYTATSTAVAGCTNFDYGSFQLSPGQSVSGCVVFEIPDAIRVAMVKWSSIGGVGTGGTSAEWAV